MNPFARSRRILILLLPALFLGMPVKAAPLVSAVLYGPNSKAYIATAVEDCTLDRPRVWVYFSTPYTISGPEYLGLEPATTSTMSVSLPARGDDVTVSMFGGISATGCITGSVQLVVSPGGKIKPLRLIIGEGAFRR